MQNSKTSDARPAFVVIAMVAVAALAAVPRLSTWADVFTTRGIRFVADGDPYYHVRRAAMILDAGAIVWRDPWLNYPAGADIPWPPLFDLLLAGTAWTAGLGHPSPHVLSVVAAILPVVLGIFAVALGAMVAAEIFGPGAGAATALLLAVSRPHVFYSLLGRPDQHVLEGLLFSAVALVFARGLRDERPRVSSVLLLGGTIALSFWNWLGSALTLLVLGSFCVVAGIATDPRSASWGRPAKLLSLGSAAAAALLAVSIALAGPPGALRTLTLGGISGFQVLVPALTAVASASLLLARARSTLARAAGLVCVPTLLVALVVITPGLRAPIARGLAAAFQANAWYGSIGEFMPFVFSGLTPVEDELREALRVFGFVPALAAIGLLEAWRRRREQPERSQAILLAMTIAVSFGVATLRMARFMMYGSLPLALFAWLGIDRVRRAAERWRPGVGPVAAALAATIAVAPAAPLAAGAGDIGAGGLEAMLLRIRDLPDQGARKAVLAPWNYGHHVLFLAGRPVIVSPFGTEGGAGAMEDLVAFYTEWDAEAAERLLERRGVQYVILSNPMPEVAMLVGHGVRGSLEGAQTSRHVALERIPELVVTRLYENAGTGWERPERPALEGFRLIDEEDPDAAPIRLFEVVPGASVRVRGGKPGGRLTATVALLAPFGAEGEWRTVRPLDERGEGRMRLPYATGPNGRILAREYLISDGTREARIRVTERQIISGAEIAIDLST